MTPKEEFIKKWSNWWILRPKSNQLTEAFKKELEELINDHLKQLFDGKVSTSSCTNENCKNCTKKQLLSP